MSVVGEQQAGILALSADTEVIGPWTQDSDNIKCSPKSESGMSTNPANLHCTVHIVNSVHVQQQKKKNHSNLVRNGSAVTDLH